MHRSRIAFLAWASASFTLVTSSFLACSSADTSPASAPTYVPEASVIEASSPEEAAAPPPGYDGGVGLGLADIADTPCSPRSGPLTVVLPAPLDGGPPLPTFRSLQRVADRRFADADDGSGFVVFDADGKNGTFVATPLLNGGSTVLGAQILHGGHIDFAAPLLQAYGPNGAALGEPVKLATGDPEGMAVGTDDKAALAVWATQNSFLARGFVGGAAAGEGPYELAVGANSFSPSMAVSSVKSGLFAVVFSGDNGGLYQTAFGRGSNTARIGDPSNLFTGLVPRSVAGLARTPSGFALVTTVFDGPSPYAMLVLMNVGGRRTSAGLKLLGTREARAVVVNGSEIGVLAHRRDDTSANATQGVEFRTFDLDGAPTGPWICMDTLGSEINLGGGVLAEGANYSAIFKATDGSTSFARFDHAGNAVP